MYKRQLNASFGKKGVTVVGVSRDTVAAQAKFKAKYDVPFALLADVESAICDAFGAVSYTHLIPRAASRRKTPC